MVSFQSIVFSPGTSAGRDTDREAPRYFQDLNLDQVVETLTAGKKEYRLESFYFQPLHAIEDIEYRHEVFADLEKLPVAAAVRSFARGMITVREKLAQAERLRHRYQKRWWLLDAIHHYCDTVGELRQRLVELPMESAGLTAFREFLHDHLQTDAYLHLLRETESLLSDLSSVRYSLLIKETSVTVRRYEGEQDYAEEIRAAFAKFSQSAAKSYLVEFSEWAEMNGVEEEVINRVALLNPELFERLERFSREASGFIDDTIARFDREIQFYLAYLDLAASLKRLDLPFCYPAIAVDDKNVWATSGFDLALAIKLAKENVAVVTNDFALEGHERLFVVTGPNQGGKTTFARAFGQLHYLAALGCPVPGNDARLFLFDDIYTHFEREETITNLRGKLHDDLVRIREILDRATPDSIIILNEIFNSTTLSDEVYLSERILGEVVELDCLGVCVTFIDELSRMNERTVSMMSTVVPDNPAERTFRVVRKEANGLAYAMAIAEKHGVTYDALSARLGS